MGMREMRQGFKLIDMAEEKKQVSKVMLFAFIFLVYIYVFGVLHEVTHAKVAYYYNVEPVEANVFLFKLVYNDTMLTPQQHDDYYYLQSLVEIASLPILGMFMVVFFLVMSKID
jgi:hypothetical protein